MSSNELLRLVTKLGWFIVRQSGSHAIMAHPDRKGRIVLPMHGKREVSSGLASAILKQASQEAHGHAEDRDDR